MSSQFITQIIKDESARKQIQNVLQDNNSLLPTVITSPPDSGKSTTIACGIAAVLHSENPDRVVLCLQHEDFAVSRHEYYIRSLAFAGGCLGMGNANQNKKKPFVIKYMTYGNLLIDLIAMYGEIQRFSDLYSGVIFDDAHCQSMEQEIVLSVLGLKVKIVLMTSFPDSGFNAGWPVVDVDLVHRHQISSNNYVNLSSRQGVTYETWALDTALNTFKAKPDAVVLVFCSTLENMLSLKLSFQQKDARTTCFLLSSEMDIRTINRYTGGKLVLGIPTFRSRWPIFVVDCVICEPYRELQMLDRTIAKDIPKRTRLSQTELKFLHAHATKETAATHTYMDEADVHNLKPGRTLEWSCKVPCEYYLKVLALFPGKTLDSKSKCRPPLRYFHRPEEIEWAVRQLCSFGLIEMTDTQGFAMNMKGGVVVMVMLRTGIDFSSAVYLALSRTYVTSEMDGRIACAFALPCLGQPIRPKCGNVGPKEKSEVLQIIDNVCCSDPFSDLPIAHTGDVLAFTLTRLQMGFDDMAPSIVSQWIEVEASRVLPNMLQRAGSMAFGKEIVAPKGKSDLQSIEKSLSEPSDASLLNTIYAGLLQAYLFNLAYVKVASSRPWMARDMCSGLDVELDENSFIDAPLLIQRSAKLYTSQPGIHVIYKSIRKCEDGHYIISDLTFVPRERVQMKARYSHIPSIDQVIASPFKHNQS